LGYEGVEAFQANDFEAAEDKLRRAFAVVKVPTLGLWLARALAKNGRWVEAAEVYREVSRLEPTEGKVEAQREAQRAAAGELETLAGKIPEPGFRRATSQR
jgi:pentatricopeptide repeat protein